MKQLPLLHRTRLKDEAQLSRCGFCLAQYVGAGDFLALNGPLGVGKTSLARAMIAARLGRVENIPSPSFSLVQTYESERLRILHGDLYRVTYESELAELGVFDADALVLLEWAERAPDFLPPDVLRLELRFGRLPDMRQLSLYGNARWRSRLRSLPERITRMRALTRFLDSASYGTIVPQSVAGDASARRYERLVRPPAQQRGKGKPMNEQTAIVMDWDYKRNPKARLRYERAARLAHVPEAFAAIAQYLSAHGIAAPHILQADMGQGFLLMEDLGQDSISDAHAHAHSYLRPAYLEAIEVLLALSDAPAPIQRPWHLPWGVSRLRKKSAAYTVPQFDIRVLQRELGLFLEWYLPFADISLSARAQAQWQKCWDALAPAMTTQTPVLVLRDFHSPNLLWRAHLQTQNRLGVIDIQDGVLGPPAYDVVSLLQDARVTIPVAQERFWLRHYMRERHVRARHWDKQTFLRSYAALGAQRACRIAGTFVRLAQQDGKPQYLTHMPRLFAYLRRNLAHPDLGALRHWFARYVPAALEAKR